MKILINGDVKPDTIESVLNKQKEKMSKINKFCKDNKIQELHYKDSEMEYDFVEVSKMVESSKPKVEARPKQVNKEIRKEA